MLEFVQHLKQRYQAILALERTHSTPSFQANLNSLALAETYLQKIELNQARPGHALQVAVIGPTQAGKSSAVNLILGDEQAGVSALAGYTVHAQGFCLNAQAGNLDWVADFFSGYERYTHTDLPHEQPLCFALDTVEAQPDHPLPVSVVWDTPDFDSIDANGYRDGVLRTIALADVILLVVSKDKYADQSVWDMMALLEPLGHPTIVCLNKVMPEARSVLLPSLEEKWQQSRQDSPLAICALPYREEGLLSAEVEDELQVLYDALNQAFTQVQRDRQTSCVGQFFKVHWQSWLAPIKAELQLQQEWRSLVDVHIAAALADYRKEFLDNDENYGTFQRAVAELLVLLEMPGFGSIMSRARRVITWPLRQVFKIGLNSGQSGQAAGIEDSKEIEVLTQLTRHVMIQTAEGVLQKTEDMPEQQFWWKSLATEFRYQKPVLQEQFDQATRDYYMAFSPEVENAAQRLYQRLEKHPAILNSLRVTRAGVDASAVALSLYTGGIGLHDFIIAPAVLSLTSLLTESALGTYMDRVIADLKRLQLAAVEQQLFDDSLKKTLYQLPGKVSHAHQFNISRDTVESAEHLLSEARYGLQLL